MRDSFSDLMQAVTGEPPKMWGSSIVGFGSYHYRYASGREGDSLVVGFLAPQAEPGHLHHAGVFGLW